VVLVSKKQKGALEVYRRPRSGTRSRPGQHTDDNNASGKVHLMRTKIKMKKTNHRQSGGEHPEIKDPTQEVRSMNSGGGGGGGEML